jgi:hypothetical protein
VLLRDNVVHSTIETDIGFKTGFRPLALVHNVRGACSEVQTTNNTCVEIVDGRSGTAG